MTKEELAISALRGLVIDMTNKANSGHPGMALDAAPALFALYRDHLVLAPGLEGTSWMGRDRFVLSAGHVSALLYAMLALTGLLSKEDLMGFRQLGSRTPGHPERGETPGVEATSGPLGQGLAQAVGMAFAERTIRARLPLKDVPSHRTYCLLGDGCLEEGVSQEAISFAGKEGLENLFVLYDENGSTLDANTSVSMKEDVPLRFLSAGWNVEIVEDGEDWHKVSEALSSLKARKGRPSLLLFRTRIGKGTAYEGMNKAHGKPLGEELGREAKRNLGVSWAPFEVPEEAKEALLPFFERGRKAKEEYDLWLKGLAPEEREKALHLLVGPSLPEVKKALEAVPTKEKESTRSCSFRALSALAAIDPLLIGGSADVASSVLTDIKGEEPISKENPGGGIARYGIREFLMAAMNNGMALHGGIRPYGGCFLVFSDYMKNAIRMSALMKAGTLYLFSHDSLAVGEDGPTHQPVEQLAALRAIPGLECWRPADMEELKASYFRFYERALKGLGPTAIVLSRQDLPSLPMSSFERALHGASFLNAEKEPKVEIIATGSEASLALEAARILKERGIPALVLSMPSMERFRAETKEFRRRMLPLPYRFRFSLEMLSPALWHEWAAHPIGVECFGASGPMKDVLARYGFTPEEIAERIEALYHEECENA